MTEPATSARAMFSWEARTVLVTGAAGFVGSWLCETLARRGARVVGLVRAGREETESRRFLDFPGVEPVRGLVEDTAAIERILRAMRVDTVFHLAAININVGPSVSPLAIFETNVRGTWSVLEASRQTPTVARIVIASSREAEGCDGVHMAETPAQSGRRHHPYSVSKIAAELIAKAYADTYSMPVTISRSDNVYGGRDLNWNRLIPGTIRSLLNGERPALRSDGTLTRDYVYIEDMVNAYLSLAAVAGDARVRGEVFHFATGIQMSALSIVTSLCELLGQPEVKPVILSKSAGDRMNLQRSTEREREILGWRSRVTIREGLRDTVSWYRKYFDSNAST